MEDKVAEFECSGDIFKLLFADQIHDFLGERGTSGSVTRTKKQLKSYLNQSWKFYGLNVDKQESFFKNQQKKRKRDEEEETIGYQLLAEKIIIENSGKSRGKELGNIKKFKNLNLNTKVNQLRFEEDLGLATRLYIQQVCKKNKGKNIQSSKFKADLHIDATKGKAYYFLTSMINLPVTARGIQESGLKCDPAIQEYFKQIKFTPVLANIFDMAAFHGLYKSSAAYYGEELGIKTKVNRFKITDNFKNTLEWELRNAPKFYNIALWFLRYMFKKPLFWTSPYDSTEVLDFNTSFGLDSSKPDDVYFLYSLMIDGFKSFINQTAELSDKSKRTCKSVIKGAFGQRKIDKKEIFTVITDKIKQQDISIMIDVYKSRSEYIKDIIDDILNMNITRPDKLLFYNAGCKSVYINKEYLQNLMFYSYITELKINVKGEVPRDYKEFLFPVQKYLQNFSISGPSVKNILNTVGGKENPNRTFTLLMLKTLGDLSISTSSFYDGIINEDKKNINFFVTFDRTAACIATTLSYNGESLYPYVLLEQPGFGTGAYLPENLGNEFNLTDIVNLGGLQIIDKETYYILENNKSNCELFKEKYMLSNDIENLDCSISRDENVQIIYEQSSPKSRFINFLQSFWK